MLIDQSQMSARPSHSPVPRKQLTIRALMVVIAGVACILALGITLHEAMFVALEDAFALLLAMLLVSLGLIVSLWLMFRKYRRLSALGFGVVATLANLPIVATSLYWRGYRFCFALGWLLPARLEGGPTARWPRFFYYTLGWFMVIPVLVGFGCAWATAASSKTAKPRRPPVLAWALIVIAASAPFASPFSHWPLRLACVISKPILDELADRVAAGDSPVTPRWAGLFRVLGTRLDTDSGNVGLVIDDHPYGLTGLVRRGPGSRHHFGPFHNLNEDVSLGGGWWFQEED
jgi:hypothetical protein